MNVRYLFLAVMLLGSIVGCAGSDDRIPLVIATVNNPDMRVMERFTSAFEAAHPNLRLDWVVLPENELRSRVTLDVAAGAATFDVVTIGTYEVPI